jgi:hypothetical protein
MDSGTEVFWTIRHIATGIISLCLLVLAVASARYTLRWWHIVTRSDRDARLASIGLTLLFGAMAARGIILYLALMGDVVVYDVPEVFPYLEGGTFVLAIIGAVYCIRAFHPFPIWVWLLILSVAAPLVAAAVL